jgi:heat shock protein HslJ
MINLVRPGLPLGRIPLLLAVVALAACGADPNDAAPSASAPGPSTPITVSTPDLEGVTWELGAQAFNLPGLDQSRPTLLMEGGMASGFGGCNRFNGTYTLAPPALSFRDIAQTQMACGAVPTAIEQAYLDRLAKVAKYTMDEPGLQLRDGSGTLLLEFSPANTSLVGSWTVTGFLTSSGSAFTSASTAGEPTAVFAADGTVSGTTGCNSYNGPYTQGPDDAVKIGPLAKTLAACTDPDLSAQEASFTKAMEASVSAEVTSKEATFLNAAAQRTLTMTRA